jgi:hypothetical protein
VTGGYSSLAPFTFLRCVFMLRRRKSDTIPLATSGRDNGSKQSILDLELRMVKAKPEGIYERLNEKHP